MSDEPTQSLAGGDPERTRPTAPAAGEPRAFPRAAIPARIGRYTIVHVLGEGGMGTVYEAEQDQPKRAVALKVIRAGYLSPQLLKRFEHESAVLGRLQHPGIAQVYEAGTVEDERGHPVPFFAMEFIRGVPLTDYASQKNLGTRERLDLVARICDAVYHAHQKGVIHRDLKPGNILVDESGQPKILDFGVARATDSDLQQTTIQTDIGAIIGTVPYMSPEQVGGDPDDLDTRSDVYALGVIAYELLAGRLPYDLTRKMIHEAARIIKEDEPTRLSSINRTLRGDVETIVAKALEKNKVRRYQSAESLASDIRRYLKDEPIAARPASTWYQVQKFSRRNIGLVTGLVAAFVLLVAGVVGTSIGLRQAVTARDNEAAARKDADIQKDAALGAQKAEAEQRKVAESQRDKAEKITEFMSDTLEGAGPSVARGRDTTMLREMMDAAAARIEKGELQDALEAELKLRGTIGFAYVEIAQFSDAQRMLEPALTLARSIHEGAHTSLVDALLDLAVLRAEVGNLDDAEQLCTEALSAAEQLAPGGDPRVVMSLFSLAHVLYQQGRDHLRAIALGERALELSARLRPGDGGATARCLTELGLLYLEAGQVDRAESRTRAALEMRRRLNPSGDPGVCNSSMNLGALLLSQNRLEEARQELQEALSMARQLYGLEHPDVAVCMNELAVCEYKAGRFEQSESLYRETLDMRRRIYGGNHRAVAQSLNNLASALYARGRASESEPYFAEALEMRNRLFPEGAFLVAESMNNLAAVRESLGRKDEAGGLYLQAVEMSQTLFPDGHPRTIIYMINLALTREEQGQLENAESLFAHAVEMHRRVSPDDSAKLAYLFSKLASLRYDLGRASEAELLYSESLEIRRRLHPGDNPDVAVGLNNLARVRETLKDFVGAEPMAREAVAMYERIRGKEHGITGNSRARLGCILAGMERYAEAERELLESEQVLSIAPGVPPSQRIQCFMALVTLYQSWDKAEPGKGYGVKAAEWKARLDALTPPPPPEPAKPAQSGRPDGG